MFECLFIAQISLGISHAGKVLWVTYSSSVLQRVSMVPPSAHYSWWERGSLSPEEQDSWLKGIAKSNMLLLSPYCQLAVFHAVFNYSNAFQSLRIRKLEEVQKKPGQLCCWWNCLYSQEVMFGKGSPLFLENTCNLKIDMTFWLCRQCGCKGTQPLLPAE